MLPLKRYITAGTYQKDLEGNTISINSIQLVKDITAPKRGFETMVFYSCVEANAVGKGAIKHKFLIDKGWLKGTYVLNAKRLLCIINLDKFK